MIELFLVFLVIGVIGFLLLVRSRAGGSHGKLAGDGDADLRADEAKLRFGNFPGPGGPIDTSG